MHRVRFVTLAAMAALLALPAIGHAQAAKPKAVSHPLEGRAQCLMCHTAGAMEAVPDVPASHVDRPNETCAWCHGPGAAIQTKDAPAVAHPLEGRAQCMMCHGGTMPSIPAAPADHEGRDVKYCTLCHTPPK
jgi:hypothetical protein